MTLHIKLNHLAAAIVVGALLVGGGYALASTGGGVISACIHKKTRQLSIAASGHCAKGYTAISWNQQGVRGVPGARGVTGARGATGADGASASVSIGNVTTGAAGSPARVTNSGTGGNAVLNFSIPQGAAGQAGTPGVDTGPTAYGQIWMGSSTAALAPGSNSKNITGVGSAGVGGAVVDVQGCSSSGLAEPVINVSADDDSHDNLVGANNTANVADAYVSGWSTEPDTSILVVAVDSVNPVTGVDVDSDFSISVTC